MTMVLFPGENAHVAQVVTHRECGYRAECVCGWASPWSDEHDAAHASASEHRGGHAGPPDDFATALCGLLDLQDDLADAVFWLAANWGPDLPAPTLVAHDRRQPTGEDATRLVLQVRCGTSAELALVARTLGAQVATASECDTGCHRAVKSIGRVRIVALGPTR
jgi:hypothetical protein